MEVRDHFKFHRRTIPNFWEIHWWNRTIRIGLIKLDNIWFLRFCLSSPLSFCCSKCPCMVQNDGKIVVSKFWTIAVFGQNWMIRYLNTMSIKLSRKNHELLQQDLTQTFYCLKNYTINKVDEKASLATTTGFDKTSYCLKNYKKQSMELF